MSGFNKFEVGLDEINEKTLYENVDKILDQDITNGNSNKTLFYDQSRRLIEQHMQKMKTLSTNQSMEKLLDRSPVVERHKD